MSDQGSPAGMGHSGRDTADATDERTAIVLVAHNERIRNDVGGELRKRYGADYDISVHDDRKGALAALESASAKHLAVALVLSAFGPNDADGIEFFDDVRPLHSEAKRVAVVRWGDFHTVRPSSTPLPLDNWTTG